MRLQELGAGTCSLREYSLASIMLNSLVVPYIVAPLRLSLLSLPCRTSFQSDLPAVSAMELQLQSYVSLVICHSSDSIAQQFEQACLQRA